MNERKAKPEPLGLHTHFKVFERGKPQKDAWVNKWERAKMSTARRKQNRR